MSDAEKPNKYAVILVEWLLYKFAPFAKAWFEFIRNLLVISLFWYIAQKSGNLWLLLLGIFTNAVFGFYSLVCVVPYFPVYFSAKYRPDRIILSFLSALVCVYLGYALVQKVQGLIDDVISSQFPPLPPPSK